MHSTAPLIRYFEADARTHLAAAPSPRPSSLFGILGSFIWWCGGLNKVYDPGFLLQQALEPFPHGRMEVVVEGGRGGGGGEAAAQTESGLSRRFSNYTLETNQPEHCFLISRTKQQCTGWTTLEVTHTPPPPHSPSKQPSLRLLRSPHFASTRLNRPHLPLQRERRLPLITHASLGTWRESVRERASERARDEREREREQHLAGCGRDEAFKVRALDCGKRRTSEAGPAEERSPNPF